MWIGVIIIVIGILAVLFRTKTLYRAWRGNEVNENQDKDGFVQYKVSDSRFWSRMFDYVLMGETRDQHDPSSKPECRGFSETNDVSQMEAMISDPLGFGGGKVSSAYCAFDQIRSTFEKKPDKRIDFKANSLLSLNNCPYQGYGNNWFGNLKKPGWYPPGFIGTDGNPTCNVSESFTFEPNSVDANYLCGGKGGSYDPTKRSGNTTCN